MAGVREEGATTPTEIVAATFWRSLSRPPSENELQTMTAFIQTQAESYGSDANAMAIAFADYGQLMLCLNEFVYVD